MDDLLIPPMNFGMIMPNVYRSGCPTKENNKFLKKLELKCILYVGTESLPSDYNKLKSLGIVKVMHVIAMEGNKEPFVSVSPEDISAALSIVLDKTLHPILLHSMKGRHREGVVVGCLRKLQGWSHVSICEEYDRFCGRYKAQPVDKRYIEVYQPRIKYRRGTLPDCWNTSYYRESYTLIDHDDKSTKETEEPKDEIQLT